MYDENGSVSKPTVFDNHIAILENSVTHSNSLRSINNLYATYSILPNLSFKTSLSSDYNLYHEKAYYNTNLVYGQPAGESNDVSTTTVSYTHLDVYKRQTQALPKNCKCKYLGF